MFTVSTPYIPTLPCPLHYHHQQPFVHSMSCAHGINKNDVSMSCRCITNFPNLSVQGSADLGWVLQAVVLQAALAGALLLLSAGVWVGKRGSAPHVLTLDWGWGRNSKPGGSSLMPVAEAREQKWKHTRLLDPKLQTRKISLLPSGQARLYAQAQSQVASHPGKGVDPGRVKT